MDFEKICQLFLRDMPRGIDYFVGVKIVFVFPKPKKTAFPYPPRPDIDNCVKSLMDAMNKFTLKDDSLVAELFTQKVWGVGPKIEVTLWRLGESSV